MMTDAQATQWGVDQAFATLTQLTAHSDSAKGAMKFLRGEIVRLHQLVYVPGLWRCPKCDFRLTRVALNVVTGTASADDTTGEKCPNCQSTLWRITERDAGNDLAKRCGELQERVTALEAIPCVVESEGGNPGWVDAKDAVRMLAELRKQLAEARQHPSAKRSAEYAQAMQATGVPHEPLQVYDSNSYRRVGLASRYREVVSPVKQRDGHPDIVGGEVLEAMVAAFNAMLVTEAGQ